MKRKAVRRGAYQDCKGVGAGWCETLDFTVPWRRVAADGSHSSDKCQMRTVDLQSNEQFLRLDHFANSRSNSPPEWDSANPHAKERP